MSLLQMSFTGAILILAIVITRALAIHKLPKRTFLVLWGIALLRLLVPFSLPSMFSAYSAIERSAPAMQAVQHTPAANFFPTAPSRVTTAVPTPVIGGKPGITTSVWAVVWAIGAVVCFLFFAVSYARCRREFQTSLPVENEFAKEWLASHKIGRAITIRRSSQVSAPLTYGVFRPVILMPKSTNWNDRRSLQFVLAHEYIHIRRFDIVTKLVLIAALCIHWFNPLVWVMYILANRDMELSCDEAVVRLFGEGNKATYARTLISMEETKSGSTPLCNSFSKNAIEERVTAIMKIKKTSLIAVFVAVALVSGITIAFATSATNENGLSVSDKGIESIENDHMLKNLNETETELHALAVKDVYEDGFGVVPNGFAASFKSVVAKLDIPDARKGERAPDISEGYSVWKDSLVIFLGSIPEKNVYLYGYNDAESGLILDVGEKQTIYAFPYRYTSIQSSAPQLAISSDGNNILMACQVQTGTGVSVSELYVLPTDNISEPFYIDTSDLVDAINSKMNMSYDAETELVSVYWSGNMIAKSEISVIGALASTKALPESFFCGNQIGYDFENGTVTLKCIPTIGIQGQPGAQAYLTDEPAFEASLSFDYDGNGHIFDFIVS